MSAVVIDSGLVHYEAFGRGQPVLFLHGWLGSWRYWMPTMEAISDKYRTYALDLWGFGDSDKTKQRFEVSDYVGLVDKFLVEEMGLNNVPIIGHALGALVALEYAVTHPDRVNKIMAVSLPMNADSVNRKLIDFANNSVMAKMFWKRQIAYKEVQQEVEKTAEGAINASIQSAIGSDIWGRIEIIANSSDMMLLTVFGEKDDMIDPSPNRNLNGTWKNVRPIGLSESKHFPMLDEAAKFNRLLQDFLDVNENLSTLELKEEWRRRTR